MKRTTVSMLAAVAVLGTAPLLLASSAPTMTVEVTNSADKVVFKSKTDKNGMFATDKLAPGNYVVQFSAKGNAGSGPLDLALNAGKKKVTADAVPASKFRGGGVAMRVQVDSQMSVVGQVAPKGQITLGSEKVADNPRVKYVNGRKFVWITNQLGSSLGGRWVDASSPEARNVYGVSDVDLHKTLDRGDPQPPKNGR